MTRGAEAPDGRVRVHDGVAMPRRGDLCLIVYQKPARLERTRWLFDEIERAFDDAAADLVGLLVVLPSADPPDAATHQENYARLRKLGARVRRLVTVPVGNAFKMSVVRAVMRGLNVVLGHSGTRFVADSIDAGITRLLEAKGSNTPPVGQILADLRALYLALGESAPPVRTE